MASSFLFNDDLVENKTEQCLYLFFQFMSSEII